MDELKTKEGVLTPADLATYGIPPKRQPSKDSNLEVPMRSRRESRLGANIGSAELKRPSGNRNVPTPTGRPTGGDHVANRSGKNG